MRAADVRSACPEDGSTRAQELAPADAAGFRYLRCSDCGLGRIDPMPQGGAAESYDEGYFVAGGPRAGYTDYEAEDAQHRRTARRRLRRVAAVRRDATAERPLLVDVGTASGLLLDEGRRAGYQVAGVELSDWARGRAQDRGLRVERTLTELDDLRGRVDVVTFFQVLEHLPDLQQELRRAAGLLAPGGVIVCETWDLQSRTARFAGARWQQLSAPSVLWLFSPEPTSRLLRSAGLEPVSWRRSPKAVSLATVLGQSLSAAPSSVTRSLVPLAARVPVPYPLDDLVTFVARRPASG